MRNDWSAVPLLDHSAMPHPIIPPNQKVAVIEAAALAIYSRSIFYFSCVRITRLSLPLKVNRQSVSTAAQTHVHVQIDLV
jgi:hypothetical protein